MVSDRNCVPRIATGRTPNSVNKVDRVSITNGTYTLQCTLEHMVYMHKTVHSYYVNINEIVIGSRVDSQIECIVPVKNIIHAV